MRPLALLACLALIALPLTALAQPAATASAPAAASAPADEQLTPARQLEIIHSLQPSLVKVEYTLQYDKGEAPNMGYRGEGSSLVDEERPLELPGFLVGADKVLTADIALHPRFIKSLVVRQGEEVVPAKLEALGTNQPCRLLRLSKPFKDAKPLSFALAEGPYLLLSYSRHEDSWVAVIRPMQSGVAGSDDGRSFVSANCGAEGVVMVDSKGVPVAMTFNDELPPDDSWKVSPTTWEMTPAAEMDKKLAALQEQAGQCVLHVRLNFRSPKKGTGDEFRRSQEAGAESGGTQSYVPGVIIGPRQVLVLAHLQPKVTARLEEITLFMPDGSKVPAKFDATLQDYCGFVAKTDTPLPAPAKLSDKDIQSYRHGLLIGMDMRLQGETIVTYFDHCRTGGLGLGWRKQVTPYFNFSAENQFIFDPAGQLVALPMAHRPKLSARESYGRVGGMLPSTAVAGIFKNVAAQVDASNIPLSAEEEMRLAWLGVELQALNRDLARDNKVSDLTSDGATGAIVSYVYAGSPAEKAGIKLGDILLRINAQDYPKPIDVTARDEYMFADRPFPWELLDRISDADFDRVPPPWPSAETSLTRTLTDLGFGKKFELEYFHDGKLAKQTLTVQQSPTHYDTAAKFKCKPLGLTVQDMTFEVRRYFQKKDTDPGVIIAKLEPGQKASIAGMKPFELITHVNDRPIFNAKEFEQQVCDATGELSFSVHRPTAGKVIKIKLDNADTQPASVPSPEAPPLRPALPVPAMGQ